MSKFTRPQSLTLPSVFYKFKAKDRSSEELVEYQVQDLPEEYIDRAVELFIQEFVPDEELCIALKAESKADTLEAMRVDWRNTMRKRFSLACFKCESDELVAVNCLEIAREKCEESEKIENPELRAVFDAFGYCYQQFNVFKHSNVEHFLSGHGLWVNREYRGRNIATEILKARAPFLKALGLKVTATVFTGIGSQKAAKKAGYKEVYSISYAAVQKVFPIYDFSRSKTEFFVTMILEA